MGAGQGPPEAPPKPRAGLAGGGFLSSTWPLTSYDSQAPGFGGLLARPCIHGCVPTLTPAHPRPGAEASSRFRGRIWVLLMLWVTHGCRDRAEGSAREVGPSRICWRAGPG